METMVTTARKNVALTVEFQRGATGWQGSVKEGAKWGGKDWLVISVRLFSPHSKYEKMRCLVLITYEHNHQINKTNQNTLRNY